MGETLIFEERGYITKRGGDGEALTKDLAGGLAAPYSEGGFK